ncbi:hypothetical protein EK904_007891 [Melospiza melodia maxima]|nr:hypothetical protein EK904_007891 [Melospiza melodia maxima]
MKWIRTELEAPDDIVIWFSSVLDDEGSSLRQQKLDRQRALLEQKQKKKRQEPLMVQSNVDSRARTRRTKHSEEQAPLVESYLNSNSSTIYHGTECHLLQLYLLRVLVWCSFYAQENKSSCFACFSKSLISFTCVWG